MKYVTLEEVCENRTSNISQKDLKGNEGIYPIYGASGLIKKVDFYIQDKEYIGIVKDGAGVGRTMLLPSKSSVIGTMQYIIPNGILNIKYLYYALISKKLSKYSSGATIPHIYFRDYKKEKIVLISEIEQQKIVSILDKIVSLIEKNKKRIILLEELVKSRFIEMFGDESKFKKKKLNENVKEMFIGPFGSSLKNECFVSKEEGFCIVYEQKHAIRKTIDTLNRYVDKKKYEELKRFTVYPGDIIVSCRGTVGEIYRIPYNAKFGIMHPSIMKIRLNNEVYNVIFFEKMLEKHMKKILYMSQGSGIKMAITAKELGKKDFIVPPLSFQNEFAEFVTKTNKLKFRLFSSIILGKNLFKNLTLLIFLDNIRLVLELDKKNKNKKLNMGVKKDV